MTTPIGPLTVLPADRTEIELHTADHLTLVGELAQPVSHDPAATLLTLHPLPTHGGYMDSHVLRKASWRLPALADLAVVRFNTRGTASPRGVSEGTFDEGVAERHDVAALLDFAEHHELPRRWLVGWSFGTELVLRYGTDPSVEGAILLSPPLHRADEADLDRWADFGRPLVVLVPELDDYLRPEAARARFTRVPQARVVAGPAMKHLWVGENAVRWVLERIVEAVNPAALPMPSTWDGATLTASDDEAATGAVLKGER